MSQQAENVHQGTSTHGTRTWASTTRAREPIPPVNAGARTACRVKPRSDTHTSTHSCRGMRRRGGGRRKGGRGRRRRRKNTPLPSVAPASSSVPGRGRLAPADDPLLLWEDVSVPPPSLIPSWMKVARPDEDIDFCIWKWRERHPESGGRRGEGGPRGQLSCAKGAMGARAGRRGMGRDVPGARDAARRVGDDGCGHCGQGAAHMDMESGLPTRPRLVRR